MSRCLRSLQISVFLIQLLKSCQHWKVAPFKKLSAFLSHAEDRKDMQLMSDMWWHVMTCAADPRYPEFPLVCRRRRQRVEAVSPHYWTNCWEIIWWVDLGVLIEGFQYHFPSAPFAFIIKKHDTLNKTKRQIPIAAYYSQQISTMFNNIPQCKDFKPFAWIPHDLGGARLACPKEEFCGSNCDKVSERVSLSL